MNEIISKLFSAEDKCMPQVHLRQPGFTYSACGPFTKNKKRIKTFKKTGESRYIYRIELVFKLVFSMIRLMEILKI